MAPEDRSLATWRELHLLSQIGLTRLVIVDDPPSRFSDATKRKLMLRQSEFCAEGGDATHECERYPLFARHAEIVEFADSFADVAGPNVVIDISSMPKRYFFPIVRRMVTNRAIENLLVTYTRPGAYPSDNMAENFSPIQYLPLFSGAYPEKKPEVVIIGVGYSNMGLPEQIEHYGCDVTLKLVFPFPPGPPFLMRNWDMATALHKGVQAKRLEIIPINGHDMSDVFDHICAWTDSGRKPCAFAPYGPKPVSLAMCIYATITDAPVQYTQPRAYDPEYSAGISIVRGIPEIYAYCLRLYGRDAYEITSRA